MAPASCSTNSAHPRKVQIVDRHSLLISIGDAPFAGQETDDIDADLMIRSVALKRPGRISGYPPQIFALGSVFAIMGREALNTAAMDNSCSFVLDHCVKWSPLRS
jgi:hypothetical protein